MFKVSHLLVLDLTSGQLKSVLFLLRQSIQRLPETYQKSFFSRALAMGESSFMKAEAPPQYSPVTFIDVKATQCTRTYTKPETKAKEEVTSVYKPDTEIQNYSMAPKNDDDTVVSQKTVRTATGTSEGKKNHCVKPKDLSSAASKATAFTPRYKLSSVWQIQPATAASVIESTKRPLIKSAESTKRPLIKSAVQKTQTNYKFDITKYMVKTQKVTLMIC
jgi:hypothetical protein